MITKNIFTLPNFLSFVRIFLVIPIFHYISIDQNNTALIYIFFALVSDGLDGYLARRFNQISEVGKVLDPLADKICTTGGFLALTLFQGFPWWITMIIIGRDFLIILGSLLLIGRKKIVIPSNIPGKISVFLITVYAISILLDWTILYTPLLIFVIIMLVVSLLYYAKAFFKNLKNETEE